MPQLLVDRFLWVGGIEFLYSHTPKARALLGVGRLKPGATIVTFLSHHTAPPAAAGEHAAEPLVLYVPAVGDDDDVWARAAASFAPPARASSPFVAPPSRLLTAPKTTKFGTPGRPRFSTFFFGASTQQPAPPPRLLETRPMDRAR